jgi:sigma-E factor negative regulatory protein RseC
MTNKAYVKEIINNKAVITIKRECACGGKDLCNTKCFTLQNDMIEMIINNEINAKTGDFVEVEDKTSAILIYAAVVFIMPVFIGLSLYFITQVFTKNIILPYVISGVGFILSVVFLYFFLNNIIKNKNDFKITKIL